MGDGRMVAKGPVRPRLLDACSCASVGAIGYDRAGWRVTSLDNDPRALAHSPFETVCRDVLEALEDHAFLSQFDAIHASFPCQLFSATRELAKAQGKGQGKAVDLLTPGLERLRECGLPWVVENVERSPLGGMEGVARVCGSSFGLKVRRHRLFLGSKPLQGTVCDHSKFEVDEASGKPRPWGVYYAMGDNIPSGGRTCVSLEHGMECMGVTRQVPWQYLREGLPPAYTEHIGKQMLEWVR